jgi:hypothetical protein
MGTAQSQQVKSVGDYKVVQVGDVVPIENKSSWKSKIDLNGAKNSLFYSKCTHGYSKKGCKCNILAYYENNNIATTTSPAFYRAFREAYNNHTDVILSPDDVWMIICLQFTTYVNANANTMRDLFVSHEGKKKLSVTTGNDLDETQWDEFFALMLEALKGVTKHEVVDLLQANFSTTTHVEKILSTAVVMDTLKQYFDYGRCIPCCGIRNVLFMGTLADWHMLLQKLTQLKLYAVSDSWRKYVDELEPVIQEFINTYKGNVNKDFWDKIMNIKCGRLGSGSTSYISGWILKFYGIYKEVECDEIKENFIDVPVDIDNRLTGIKKTVNIVGGFTGLTKVEIDNYIAHRPHMSFIVYHDGNESK